jgi:oligopeptide transport system substrate-binding protein
MARQLLAEAGYPDGEGWPGVEIVYNTQEAHRKIAVAVQQMWKDELNIDVTISNQEWKVYLDSVSTMNFDVARRGWIGDYVDPNNFLDLYLTDGGNNNTGFADPVYDDLISARRPGHYARGAFRRVLRGRKAAHGADADHPDLHLHQQTPDSPERLRHAAQPDGFAESQVRVAGPGAPEPRWEPCD